MRVNGVNIEKFIVKLMNDKLFFLSTGTYIIGISVHSIR